MRPTERAENLRSKQTTNKPRQDTRRPPIRIDLVIEIPASQGRVFSYLSDLENNPHWNWAVAATTPLHAGPPRQGSRFLQQRTVPRPGGDVLEITGYRPDTLLEVSSRLEEGEVRYRYELAPLDAEQTRVCVTVELDSSDHMDRTDLYAARMGAAIAANLENLRRVVTEVDPTTTQPEVSSGPERGKRLWSGR